METEAEVAKTEVVKVESIEVGRKRRLTAREIIAVDDVKTVEVDVPEWNGSVLIRSLSAGEALDFHAKSKEDKNRASLMLLVCCIVDDDGKPIFKQSDIEDLQGKSLKAINRIQEAALELNGLNKKDAKEAAKND